MDRRRAEAQAADDLIDNKIAAPDFLLGGGEMGALMRTHDWSGTPVGPPESWPQSLKTAIGIMLTSRCAMFVWWGHALTNLYNDSYRPVLGARHPAALGRSARDIWSEIWDLIGPRTDNVLSTGEATVDEDLLLVMERHGYPEETYFTFSYSPIPDDQGGVGGLFCVAIEETQRIIGARRLKLLRDVTAATADASSAEEACQAAADCLATEARDLPFAALYLVEANAKRLRLAGVAGIAPGHLACPQSIELGAMPAGPWPLDAVIATGEAALIEDLASRFGELPKGAWDRPPSRAIVAPIARRGQARPAGLLVAGLNPYRLFDDAFRGFVDLLAGRVAAAIADAQAETAQRRSEHILESIGDAFYALDADWRFTYVNRRTEELWGRRRETLIGRVIWEEFPQAVGSEAHERHLEAARERRMVSFQAVSPILHRWLDVRIYPSGTGLTVYFRDIENRKRTEQALRESENRLRLAVEATEMGTWDIDPATGMGTWSDRCKALFGLPPEATITYEIFLARLHPEDRERTHRAVRNALDPAGGGELDIEYRTIGLRDDVERWIADKGRAFFQDGRAVRFIGTVLDITESKRVQEALREESRTLEILNRTGAALAADLDHERIVQTVTDAATELSGAQFGSFFYNVVNEQGEAYMLYTLSGAPREAFAKFPMPRNTAVFDPTFRGTGIVRSDDITKDPRYGKNAPHHGMPKGHLPVRSYLAVPVISRSGEALGGLFFGHERPGVFTERAERIVAGIAGQAAVALDNARLYADAQREIAERRRAEKHQRLLLHELNHRVKNSLAAVQSIALHTLQSAGTLSAFRESFDARLLALSQAHNLLTRESWQGAALREVILEELAPYRDAVGPRFAIRGPEVRLGPKAALALGMAFHELAINAVKYGALSKPGGRVEIAWTPRASADGERLDMLWRETGGPRVEAPRRKGFGSRLIERGLAHELDGAVQLDFAPDGVCCRIEFPLSMVHSE